MPRRSFLVLCVLCTLCLLRSALAQDSAKVYIQVLMPTKDAILLIDDKPTKATGEKRLFVTPALPAGKTFNYTITAKWPGTKYSETIRTRIVAVQGGKIVQVDLRSADDKHPDKFLIKFVPTPDEIVDEMCELANVGKDDIVYDLGCGDGRIVIAAVDEYEAKRGVGIDIDEKLIKEAIENAKEEKVSDKVEFRVQDVLTLKEKDLADATVVMLYMGDDINKRLMPVLKKALKPGARIVSHDFPMGDWEPDKKITVEDENKVKHDLYLWVIKK